MTEKELRKLSRYQLLELLLVQTDRANRLQKQLDEAREELAHRELHLNELGSIAQAAVQISGVFEAAQKAADLYMNEVRKHAVEIEQEARRKAAELTRTPEDTAYALSVITRKDEET